MSTDDSWMDTPWSQRNGPLERFKRASSKVALGKRLSLVGTARRDRLKEEVYGSEASIPPTPLEDLQSIHSSQFDTLSVMDDGMSVALTSFQSRSRLPSRRRRRSSRAAHRRARKSIEEEINNMEIQKLHEYFKAADTDNTGELSEAQFIHGFKNSPLGSGKSVREIRDLFNRIDANANGAIDWDEFSSYILLTGLSHQFQDVEEHSRILYEKDTSPEEPIPMHLKHKDRIVKIVLDDMHDHYYTFGVEGTVRRWDRDSLSFLKVIYESRPQDIVDMIIVEREDDRHLVLLGLDRSILFYSCAKEKYIRSLRGVCDAPLDSPREVVVKEIIKRRGRRRGVSGRQRGREFILDRLSQYPEDMRFQDRGERFEFELLREFMHKPNVIRHYVRNGRDLFFIGTESGHILCYDLTMHEDDDKCTTNVHTPIHTRQHHKSTVTDIIVEDMPGLSFSIASSSKEGTIRVTLLKAFLEDRMLLGTETRLLGSRTGTKNSRIHHGHNKTVVRILWNKNESVLFSCGLDRQVLLWNPLISKIDDRITEPGLRGFIDMGLNVNDKQLIILDQDSTLRIWDLNSTQRSQVIGGDRVIGPDGPYTALLFDEQRRRIVVGAKCLESFSQHRTYSEFKESYSGHQRPLLKVLYNEKLRQCVTSDDENIRIWSIETGDLKFRFKPDDSIITLCFDGSQRRLVCSHPNGVIKTYNMFSGGALQTFASSDKNDVLGLCYITLEGQETRLIAGGGHSRIVYVWDDTEEDSSDQPIMTFGPLQSEIMCIEFCGPHSLAVGLANGCITIVDLNTGIMRTTRNLHEEAEKESLDDKQSQMLKSPWQKTGKEYRYIESLLWLREKPLILVSSQGDGVISFWDVRNLTRSLVSLKIDSEETSVTTLACSESCNTLVAGDYSGRVTVFDLSKMPGNSSAIHAEQVRRISSWKVHYKSVESIAYVSDKNLVVTASQDRSSRVFDLYGLPIGFFGQDMKWAINDPSTYGKRNFQEALLRGTPDDSHMQIHRVFPAYDTSDSRKVPVRHHGNLDISFVETPSREAQSASNITHITSTTIEGIGADMNFAQKNDGDGGRVLAPNSETASASKLSRGVSVKQLVGKPVVEKLELAKLILNNGSALVGEEVRGQLEQFVQKNGSIVPQLDTFNSNSDIDTKPKVLSSHNDVNDTECRVQLLPMEGSAKRPGSPKIQRGERQSRGRDTQSRPLQRRDSKQNVYSPSRGEPVRTLSNGSCRKSRGDKESRLEKLRILEDGIESIINRSVETKSKMIERYGIATARRQPLGSHSDRYTEFQRRIGLTTSGYENDSASNGHSDEISVFADTLGLSLTPDTGFSAIQDGFRMKILISMYENQDWFERMASLLEMGDVASPVDVGKLVSDRIRASVGNRRRIMKEGNVNTREISEQKAIQKDWILESEKELALIERMMNDENVTLPASARGHRQSNFGNDNTTLWSRSGARGGETARF